MQEPDDGLNRAQVFVLVVLVVIVAGLVVIVSAGTELWRQDRLSWAELLNHIGVVAARPSTAWHVILSAPGPLLIVLTAFNKWGWRYLTRTAVSPRPIMHGTWRATIEPTVELGPVASASAIDGYMVCRQTYTSLRMDLYTQNTRSRLIARQIIQDGEGYQIAALYYCVPADGSPIDRSNIEHNGAMRLTRQVITNDWAGDYFMDRELVLNSLPTRGGRLRLSGRVNRVFATYSEAQMFYPTMKPASIFGRMVHSRQQPPPPPVAGV